MSDDQLFYKIVCLYRKQRAFDGARVQLALWRAFRIFKKRNQKTDPGEFTINFGRKYKGKKIKDIPKVELAIYLQFLQETVIEGTPLSVQVNELKKASLAFHSSAHSRQYRR